MKQKILLLAFLGMTGISQAQPQIQASEFDYMSGGPFTYQYFSGVIPVSLATTGADAQWDFSSLVASDIVNYNVLACPGDINCSSFPDAEHAVILAADAKQYYHKTASELFNVGEFFARVFTFNDQMKILEFPVAYNQVFTDIYDGSSNIATRSGSLTSTIDGYGTLKTPTGTYTNVLRQKIVDTITYTNTTTGVTSIQRFVSYHWMVANLHHYVLAIFVAAPLNQPEPISGIVYFSTESQPPVVGIDDRNKLAAAISVYPNPVGNYFYIRTGALKVRLVSVFNTLGQHILDRNLAGRDASADILLDNLQLSPGTYWLRLDTDKGAFTKQITIN